MAGVTAAAVIADREHGAPLRVRRDPRQRLKPRDQTAPPSATVRGAIAAADRVAVTNALLDDEVVEQTHDRDPKLKRRVRQPGTCPVRPARENAR
jgi:hypothetical protein